MKTKEQIYKRLKALQKTIEINKELTDEVSIHGLLHKYGFERRIDELLWILRGDIRALKKEFGDWKKYDSIDNLDLREFDELLGDENEKK